MSRRRRALAFLLLALLAAAGAAAIADGYGASAVRGYGPLRPVVVLGARIAAGQRIGPEEIGSTLTVRRVPDRFVPPGALVAPGEALGLIARAPLPAGSYLLAAQLGIARKARRERPSLTDGRRPVEIAVSGADALLAAGPSRPGSRVDVVVTSEPAGAGPGRTYVAAPHVALLALRPGSEGTGPGTTAAATLGLTKSQALRLIAAESFARKVTLLPED
ncbi:MAG TPA: Flp pilus assembly protein CpaB [Solirubrobacterales bacterium]|nr:Flp pilus assembly protein CpaB [Solirubrobacterales bacterium]